MAILKAGNTELEIRYHRHYPSSDWTDISFAFRHSGHSVFNPVLFAENTLDEKFINWNMYEDDLLIEFFEKVLYKKDNAKWDLWPEDRIRLKAETSQGNKVKREKELEGKTCWVKDGDGPAKEVPYIEAIQPFASLFEDYFELQVSIEDGYFEGNNNGYETVRFIVSMRFTFDSLEIFLKELKKEFKVFQLLKLQDHEN